MKLKDLKSQAYDLILVLQNANLALSRINKEIEELSIKIDSSNSEGLERAEPKGI